jgi:hypothetical protein
MKASSDMATQWSDQSMFIPRHKDMFAKVLHLILVCHHLAHLGMPLAVLLLLGGNEEMVNVYTNEHVDCAILLPVSEDTVNLPFSV